MKGWARAVHSTKFVVTNHLDVILELLFCSIDDFITIDTCLCLEIFLKSQTRGVKLVKTFLVLISLCGFEESEKFKGKKKDI